MPTSRSPWLKWLLIAALIATLVFGVVRALNKRKVQQAAAQAAALALQNPPAFQIAAADLVKVQTLDIAQAVAVSGSLKAVKTALIKAKTVGEIAGLQKR